MLLTMSKRFGLLVPSLVTLLAAGAVAPAAAGAAGTRSTPVVRSVQTQQARFGGGFRARPSFGSRYRSRYPGYRSPYRYRSHPFRGFGGSILRALGIAYLLHLAFGWGAGGSPLGLLLLVALIAWLVTRRRRRSMAY
jgi:predicted lipid-binding transport protein (Tim44 family)